MKLYYSKGACSLVVHILINELNLKVDYIAVDLQNKKTQSGDDFWTINSKGAVPVLELKDSEILTENAVILQYLADSTKAYHLLPEVGDFQRYKVLEWVNYITTELHKSFSPLFNASLNQEVKDNIFIPLLKKKLTYVDKQLDNKTYLLGDSFTLPDVYLFVMLFWAKSRFGLKEWSNLTNYYERLLHRESVRRSFEEEGIGDH